MTQQDSPILLAALLLLILVLIALTAIIDHIHEAWKGRTPPPPHMRLVNYHCAVHGHRYMGQDGLWLCAHCGDTVCSVEEPTELGHQGQTGRAA